ncbi:L-serine ammonia-lyase, iron-sulfur-dependent subunit beta [uncultured Clostridium sp.]|uniref:L-serine ammonia-lyase, iron-sulfur-dependent subunit beta n=1 Tax=uncultured Clostridium sp. TaxID=59620 RepID=UPI0025FB8F8A|nr:L-serine ammonia-lyase, iron-sulfur-dependent subunit beta [uncultured Clostridium sp.]
MKNYSAFDILGPIMIGPSSSHTAGAARLGKIASTIAAGDIVEVRFLLHGSFAKTYKGHGTDKALVAGILGFDPWDEEIKESFEIARARNIKFSFEEVVMEGAHPNTVKFIIKKVDNSISTITGSSIGGGNVIVTEINGMDIEFTGEYPTLIINHKDKPGMISKVSTVISNDNINIAFLKVYRSKKGKSASMIFEMDNTIPETIVEEIKEINDIESVTIINPIKEG